MLVPVISESFSRLARLPHFAPQGFSLPWLVAFTTLAQREGLPLDFAADKKTTNRRELEDALAPLTVTWLTLEHGAKIAVLDNEAKDASVAVEDARGELAAPTAPTASAASPVPAAPTASPLADAAIITQPGRAVAFTTADCVPLVCVSAQQRVVAAIHAGWRGLAAGIVERTIEVLTNTCDIRSETLNVWIGPAIAGEDYEVGAEVKDALFARPAITEAHFLPSPGDPTRFLADLPAAATSVLVALGIPAAGIERCPFSTMRSPLLHSVRRDGAKAGRMATVVGITSSSPAP
jgi:YfiH family protein